MQIKDKVFILTGVARIGIDVANTLAKSGVKTAVSYFTTGQILYVDEGRLIA